MRQTGSSWPRLARDALLTGVLLGSACGKPAPPPAPKPPAPLRLVVLIVVDQLPSWSFDRDADLVEGGIARLLGEGIYYPHAEIPFSATNTSSGHAALGSGASPAQTGILATEWWHRDRGGLASSVADPDCAVFWIGRKPAPTETRECASGRQLAVAGLADILRKESGGRAKSVAIALKLRAAILATGRRPDLAIWYDPDQAAMTTSSYYVDRAPPWLADLAKRRPSDEELAWEWTASDPALLARVTAIPDDAPGEGSFYGLDTSFPHSLGTCSDPNRALRVTPVGTDLTVAAAIAAIDGESLGADEITDLLSVSFSAHDYAGHLWGQESWERLDLFLRLDRRLGELLDAIDERVGHDNYAVVFTSDHGATRMVEQSVARGHHALRVVPTDVVAAANSAIATILGDGDWVVSLSGSTLYMSAAFAARPAPDRDRALDAAVGAIAKIDGINYVARSDRIGGDCAARAGIEASACRSLHAERSGEIFVGYGPDCLLTTYTVGTGHGSANPDDSVVPIILSVPGRAPRRADTKVSTLSVTTTIAELLGISAPPAARAPPLR